MPSFKQTAAIVAATCAALLICGSALAGLVIWSGIYDVAATSQHSWAVFRVVTTALDRSIEQHAKHISVPFIDTAENIHRGFGLYRAHCATCHGEPGIAPRLLATGMTPVPPPIVTPARERPPEQLFWLVKHGIKMTGMPAWSVKLSDADIWAVVAFLKRLPEISPAAYEAILAADDQGGSLKQYLSQPSVQLALLRETNVKLAPGGNHALDPTRDADKAVLLDTAASPPLHAPVPRIEKCESSMSGCETRVGVVLGDPKRGKIALRQFGCTSCHLVTNIVSRDVRVGPPLRGIAQRAYIAGHLPNTPDNLIAWIRQPRSIKPRTAMPDLGVDDKTAHDIVAYLYGAQ